MKTINKLIMIMIMMLFTLSPSNYAAESYSASIVPEGMTVQEKKQRFRALIAPAVEAVYQDLLAQYQTVASQVAAGETNSNIETLKQHYKVTSDQDLLMALKPHPRSIAMAQAAVESGWATSHFFKDANNVFGEWSFDENEPRIAAGQHRGDKTIWLKKYASIEGSIRDYYYTLAKGKPYQSFRALKMISDDPYALVKELDHYSEIGAKYGEELAAVIKYNKFYDYD